MEQVILRTVSHLCFDDVLLEPVFSNVRTRQDVDLVTDFLGLKLSIPVINSNMDTVASPKLSKVLVEYGTVGSIHRFCSIEDNVLEFVKSTVGDRKPIVSVGIGDNEFQRASALYNNGAEIILLDVAHAANIAIVEMYNRLSKAIPVKYIVGNFGTGLEIEEFLKRVDRIPEAVCVGIGGGSMCLTRVVTGIGIPTLASIIDCAPICEKYDIKMMVNGGIRNSGDIVKALAAGADLIMLGSMFAGTDEALGKPCLIRNKNPNVYNVSSALCGQTYCQGSHKEYRGSASLSSYEDQGKVASWRSPEGDSTWVPLKGPAVNVLNQINGGIRSACSYLNAFNISELRAHAKFRYVTSNTVIENKAHGK